VTAKIVFIRPQSLDSGEIYLFRERNYHGMRQTITTVKFVNYTPCPAIVIIKYMNGSKQRCLREDLFEFRITEGYQAAWIKLISLFRRYTNLGKIRLENIYQNIRIALLYPAN
jgi:hypothetical protein